VITARLVDERDIGREIASPIYRVCFWEQALQAPPSPDDRMGHRSAEHELIDATSVHEALAWAHANAGAGRTFVLYAVVDGTRVKLAGVDPTDPAA
jgi:hypothetical protein